MKSQQVRVGVIAVAVVGLGVGGYLWAGRVPAPEAAPAVVAETQALGTPSAPLAAPADTPARAPQPAPAPAAEPAAPPAPAAQPAAASVTARDPLLTLAGVLLDAPARAAASEDYLKGQGPRFDLFDDDGDGDWDRAKIDFERDEVWDETWTRAGETVQRKLEVSGQRLVLRDGHWELAAE